MSGEDIQLWLSIAAAALGIGSMIYTWLTSRATANAEGLSKLAKDVAELTRRADHLDTEIRHLPDKDTVHQIEVGMAEMRGEIGRMSETSQATQRTVQRIESHLMGTGK